MIDQSRERLFARLFYGRVDAYGTEEGGCKRVTDQTLDGYLHQIALHLHGNEPMGVYPMCSQDGEWQVRWGCVDFDEGEEVSFVHALNLQTVLEAFGISGWIERSRSKGYHVWVFASEFVPAQLMRRSLYAACQIAKAPTKEVNPKQETLTDGKIGNYVRLPYPNGWAQTHRRCMVDEYGSAFPLEMFVDLAFPTRVGQIELEPLLEFYEPPQICELVDNGIRAVDGELPSTQKMNARAYKVWKEGPFEGKDRSSALWKLVTELKKSGYGYAEARLLVFDADRRWGKHHARDDVLTLERMVSKVYPPETTA